MIHEHEEREFSLPATADALLGTWEYPAAEEPSGRGYFHFAQDGRLFQFIHRADEPAKRIAMTLLWSVESWWELRLRPNADAEGWGCRYSLAEGTLTLMPATRIFSCRRLDGGEVPAWFSEALGAAN